MSILVKKQLNKPKLVWLDTNVVVSIKNALKSGNKELREYRLYQGLRNAQKRGDLICPIVYQRDEYSRHHSESEKNSCDTLIVELSHGVKFSMVTEHIFIRQFERMLEVYRDQKNEFELEASDVLLEDTSKKSAPFQVVVLTTGYVAPNQDDIDNYLITDFKRRKTEVRDLKLSYEQIRKSELSSRKIAYNRPIEGSLAMYQKMNPEATIMHFQSLLEGEKFSLLKTWLRVFGKEEQERTINAFFNSDYYEHIPFEDIHTRLVTNILLSDKEPQKNDIQDLQNITIVLPYVDYMITEKAMKGYIYKEKLDQKYLTEVYDLSDIDTFLAKIGS